MTCQVRSGQVSSSRYGCCASWSSMSERARGCLHLRDHQITSINCTCIESKHNQGAASMMYHNCTLLQLWAALKSEAPLMVPDRPDFLFFLLFYLSCLLRFFALFCCSVKTHLRRRHVSRVEAAVGHLGLCSSLRRVVTQITHAYHPVSQPKPEPRFTAGPAHRHSRARHSSARRLTVGFGQRSVSRALHI